MTVILLITINIMTTQISTAIHIKVSTTRESHKLRVKKDSSTITKDQMKDGSYTKKGPTPTTKAIIDIMVASKFENSTINPQAGFSILYGTPNEQNLFETSMTREIFSLPGTRKPERAKSS